MTKNWDKYLAADIKSENISNAKVAIVSTLDIASLRKLLKNKKL